MDYGGNWPDQNFSDPSFQDDLGSLRPIRRSAPPPAADLSPLPGAISRAPRRFVGSQRPLSAGPGLGSRQLHGSTHPFSSMRHNRAWPLEDPFSLSSLAPQLRQNPRNMCTDLEGASSNRMLTVPSVRRSTSDGVNASPDPCLPSKHQWPSMYHNSSFKYCQNKEDPINDCQWNIYDHFVAESKNTMKENLPKSCTTSWQYHSEIEQQNHFLKPGSHPNLSGSVSMNRPELLVKKPQDYETLIRNMEEVEEREINACLKDDFYNPHDMGDWSKDSVHAPLDTVMLENFEELEQLIQEEDDDVQMALHIEDQQFPLQKGKKMASDYLELQKPVYQGNTDYDESDDDLSPEVAAAMMHSEEQGIMMGSAPSRVFNALFSDREKEPLAVFSACPLHPESVVVPTADGEIPYSPSAEDLTALASVSLGEEPPNGSVFSDTLRKRGTYDAVMTEASRAYTTEQDSDPDKGSFTSLSLAVGGNLECVLDPACPPTHFSKVQLRGSIRPHWFPGYYKALPHIKGITAVCSDPGIVMEDAWWTLQTTIA